MAVASTALALVHQGKVTSPDVRAAINNFNEDLLAEVHVSYALLWPALAFS